MLRAFSWVSMQMMPLNNESFVFYVCLSALHRYTQTAQRCEGVLVYWKSMEPLTLSSVLFLITCNDSIHIISPKRRLEVCMIRADALHNCWLIHSFVARMCVCGYFTPLIALFLKKSFKLKVFIGNPTTTAKHSRRGSGPPSGGNLSSHSPLEHNPISK